MKSIFANDRLRLSITDECNFACPYCTNEGQLHNFGKQISLDFVRRLAAQIDEEDIYVRKLNITGGEPMLHPQVLEIVRACVTVSQEVTLNTNGSLLSRRLVRRFHGAGLHNIKFGIDSFFQPSTKPTPYRTGHQPARILDTIRYTCELMPRSSVNVVVTDYNRDELERTLDFIEQHGINKAEILELIPFDFRRMGKRVQESMRVRDMIRQVRSRFCKVEYNRRLAKYLCWTHDGRLIQFAEDFCHRRVCQNLWTRLDARERLVPCIKAGAGMRVSFSEPLSSQIARCNEQMCNGPEGYVPRDGVGRLCPGGEVADTGQADVSLAPLDCDKTSLDP